MNILVLGSATMDVMVDGVENIARPRYNKMEARAITLTPGGGAVNVACNLTEIGASVRIACSVGNDREGDWLIRDLKQIGITTDYIEKHPDYPTGKSVILLSHNGEPTVYTQRAASTVLNLSKLAKLNTFDLIYSASLSPHAFYEFERLIQAAKTPPKIAMNPGMRQLKDPLSAYEIVRMTDLLCLNFEEARVLCDTLGIHSTPTALAYAHHLLEQGVTALLLTLGAKGSLFVSANTQVQIPASKHTIVSAIGAGDCFCSSFAYAWIQGMSPDLALEYARDRTDLILQVLGANRLPYLLDALETHP